MKKLIGENILIDILNLKNEFLTKKFLLNLLKKLNILINFTPVGKPVVKNISSNKYPQKGYSIFQIVKESHISFHTWSEYNYLAIDIFSCKKLPKNKLKSLLRKFLETKEGKIKIKIKAFPREITI